MNAYRQVLNLIDIPRSIGCNYSYNATKFIPRYPLFPGEKVFFCTLYPWLQIRHVIVIQILRYPMLHIYRFQTRQIFDLSFINDVYFNGNYVFEKLHGL